MEEFTRTYSVIHLDSVFYNIDAVKRQVGEDTKILAIVKANAYGHGAVRIAQAIKDRVYGFAVATVREALELRHNGIDNFILIIGYACKAEYETMLRNNISFALLTNGQLQVRTGSKVTAGSVIRMVTTYVTYY